MPDKIFLTPTAGVTVLHPVTRQPLPPEGKEVDHSIYWRRRLADGSVTASPGPAAAKESDKKNKSTRNTAQQE